MASRARSQAVADPPSEVAPQTAATPVPNLDNPELYINRELSLLDFQRRVIEEAEDESNPLLERLKFLAILSSNLDEFFMVRVAGLLKQIETGSPEIGIDGRAASEQMPLIREKVKELSQLAHILLTEKILPALAEAGISIRDIEQLSAEERAAYDGYFLDSVFPVLTPLAFDPGRPFPHISNRSLNLAVLVGDRLGKQHFARLKIPDTLPQIVSFNTVSGVKASSPGTLAGGVYVWIEQLVAANLSLLFPGMEVLEAYSFRLIRDAEVAIQELESDDLLESIEEALRQRKFMSAVRLQVDARMPDSVLDILVKNIEINPLDVYRVERPLGLSRFMELYGIDRPDLKDKPFVPYVPPSFGHDFDADVFALIRRGEVLLHHPFESFQPITEFLRQAANDPDVLAIKMTLYRVGSNSPIVAALRDATEQGKQVAVLVELKARFDEESNIEWARTLEDAGVHVVYGLLGLKVHSKIALVVRREGGAIRRYLHLGTGNYNPSTARLYTDFGFLTANEELGEDATYFFNALTGYSQKHAPRKLLAAPITMQDRLQEMVRREIRSHEKDGQGHLIFKMNALEDPHMIKLIYQASQAGVKIDLLVRGLCCLRPGIPGVSETVRVISIVGRFLEHSRVYYFRNGGAEEVYLGSADLMRRNLRHRVEIIFPVENPALVARLKDVLAIYMKDQAKARILQPDGSYVRSPQRFNPGAFDSQAFLLTHPAIPEKSVRTETKRNHKKRAAR